MAQKLNWADYLDRLPGGPSDRQIAAAASTNPSTVTRWRKGQDPHPRHAVAVARRFDLNPLTALSAAGYLSVNEIDSLFGASGIGDSLTLAHTPTLVLAEEVVRRLRDAE